MSIRSSAIGLAAVVVLMGAGAAQSLTGSNTVFGDDIVDGTITTPDLKNGALSGSKILDNSVTGTDVNEATLALTCPSDMTKFRDTCVTPARAADRQDDAREDCANEGLRLPSLSEAGVILAAGESIGWTDETYIQGAEVVGVSVSLNSGFDYDDPISTATEYRCVTTVGARP